jgi:hypothetical protein
MEASHLSIMKNIIHQIQYLRKKAKWWTVGSSIITVVVCYIVETSFVDFSSGSVKEKAPFLLSLLYRLSLLSTFLLGLFTFPRWYSLVAFASVILVLMIIVGR